jgi:histone H3/H4
MAYTQEGIMAQVWIAFGQGAGAIRVSHDAAMELRRWYFDAITPEVINERWQTDAVQALDRIRAIGRLAALTAAGAGSTVIKPEDIYASAKKVQAVSCTPLCPPDPDGDPDTCGNPGVEWRRGETLSAGAADPAARHH